MCYARRQRSSWARIKLSKSLYQNNQGLPRSVQSSCFRVLLLASFTFCLSSILIQRIVRDPFRTYLICFVLLSCCSIFKDHSAPAFAATPLLYHFLRLLSSPFLQVFSNFFQTLVHDRRAVFFASPRFGRAWLLYYFSRFLSTVFLNFFVFFHLLVICTIIQKNIVRRLFKRTAFWETFKRSD